MPGISRIQVQVQINNPTTRLQDDTIDAMRVKNMKLNLLSKAPPSNMNDALTKVELG